MDTSPDTTRLGSRIKLFKHQLDEWKRLLFSQREVRRLIQERIEQRTAIGGITPKIVVLTQITQLGDRLTSLSIRQTEERQQLRLRHQQEEAALETVLKAHQNDSEQGNDL